MPEVADFLLYGGVLLLIVAMVFKAFAKSDRDE